MLALYTFTRSVLFHPHVVLLSAASMHIFLDADSQIFFVCLQKVSCRSRVIARNRGSVVKEIALPPAVIVILRFASRLYVEKRAHSDFVALSSNFYSLLHAATTSTVLWTLAPASSIVFSDPFTATSSANSAFTVFAGLQAFRSRCFEGVRTQSEGSEISRSPR